LIEPRGPGPSRVFGILEQDADGFWIGGLKLLQADEAYLGRRALITGRIAQGGFLPTRIDDAHVIAATGPVSIESYVRARDGRVLLGSGLAARGDAFSLDRSLLEDVRAVLHGRVGPDGELSIDTIRLARTNGEGEGQSGGSPGPGSSGPGGFGPGGGGRSSGNPGGGSGGEPGGPGGPGGGGPGGGGPGGGGPGGGGGSGGGGGPGR